MKLKRWGSPSSDGGVFASAGRYVSPSATFLVCQILVRRLNRRPAFQERRLDAGADDLLVEEIRRVAVAGAADDQNVLARVQAILLERLNDALGQRVVFRIDPADLILVSGNDLRRGLIAFLRHEAGVVLLDDGELAFDDFLEGFHAI